MKKTLLTTSALFIAISAAALPPPKPTWQQADGEEAEAVIEKTLSDGWLFARDDNDKIRGNWLDGVDTSSWQSVHVPHDWAITGPFDPKLDGETAKLPWRGKAWYRNWIEIPESAKGKLVYLDFDGVMCNADVYVNGELVGGWDYGYVGFRVDATPFVKPGEKNLIAVHVDTTQHSSRWYPGAGIYRKVVLRTKNFAHFLKDSVYAKATADGKVVMLWEVEDFPNDAKIEVKIPRAGVEKTVDVHEQGMELTVVNPALWDIDSPELYAAEVRIVSASGATLDREFVRFGFRAAEFRPGDGFWLNGRRLQLKGANLHSDLGLLGMAFDENAARRQLVQMKDMGCNAIRFSHNPPAPEMLDICDELGLVVWDECFDKWDKRAGRRRNQDLVSYVSRNLRAFVRRDRNHPSVIVWSISNEIMLNDPYNGLDYCGQTRSRNRYFKKIVELEDDTRAVGCGNTAFMNTQRAFEQDVFADLDVTGWNYFESYNYGGGVRYQHPEKGLVYSESASAVSSYGTYSIDPLTNRLDRSKLDHQCDGYDREVNAPDIPEHEFARMERDKFVAGEFVWTGIDYLGEPAPYWDTPRSSYFGCVALTGVPKDRFYLYRSYWNDKATTCHILPHWNWKTGDNVPVYVYTSGDSAELFLNGKSLGWRRKSEKNPDEDTDPYYELCDRCRLRWLKVAYEPGELKAVCYKDGQKIGEAVVRTAGEPVAVKLDTETVGDVAWANVSLVDKNGVRCPTATNRCHFKIEGDAELLGVGNPDATCLESFAQDNYPLFAGSATCVIRKGAGAARLIVSCDGMTSAAVDLE